LISTKKMKTLQKKNSMKWAWMFCTAIALMMPLNKINAKNPIITDIYTADPSARVWADGRLYVYASHDISPNRGCDLMDQYHVYSTSDMVHWKDHGEILRASQVPWGFTTLIL